MKRRVLVPGKLGIAMVVVGIIGACNPLTGCSCTPVPTLRVHVEGIVTSGGVPVPFARLVGIKTVGESCQVAGEPSWSHSDVQAHPSGSYNFVVDPKIRTSTCLRFSVAWPAGAEVLQVERLLTLSQSFLLVNPDIPATP